MIPISAIIPTYNRAPLLARAVESALTQTCPATEVIVIDDGSMDDSAAQVAKFGSKVRYIRQANAGASEARNHGVRVATTEWIAFLDSDDVWVNTHLERMSAAIAATEGRAPVYFSDMEQTKEDGGGSLWESIGFHIRPPFEIVNDASAWVMMDRQPMMLQSGVFMKSRYLECGGLWKQLRLTHDTHFFLKLCLGRPACAVAGYGSIQTSDDDAQGTRLTQILGTKTRAYWEESSVLWQDVMKLTAQHSPDLIPIARQRASDARWRIARLDLANGRIVPGVLSAIRAFIVKPSLPLVLARRAGSRQKIEK